MQYSSEDLMTVKYKTRFSDEVWISCKLEPMMYSRNAARAQQSVVLSKPKTITSNQKMSEFGLLVFVFPVPYYYVLQLFHLLCIHTHHKLMLHTFGKESENIQQRPSHSNFRHHSLYLTHLDSKFLQR